MPEQLRAINRAKPIPELILGEIDRLISAGSLKPGDRLPSESELAESFGVSRSSLREAMRALQLLGVVEVIQGKGTFLHGPRMLPLVVDWARISSMGLISQVMEVRRIIEVAVAQLAAERATEEDLATMRAALQREEEAVRDSDDSGQASVEFHLALADATHNEVLTLMSRTVRDMYVETARQTQVTPDIARARLEDHRQLLESVAQRDPEMASKFMAEHIERGRRFLVGG